LHVPFAVGLLDAQGRDIPLRTEDGAVSNGVLHIKRPRETFRFLGVPEPKALSLNRGFSAPVNVAAAQSGEARAFLMAHDSDPFARWEAGQQYATDLLLAAVAQIQKGTAPSFDPAFIDAIGEILKDEKLEKAFIANAIILPSEDFLSERMTVIDVDAIHAARDGLRRQIAKTWKADLKRIYDANRDRGAYSPDAEPAGRRALKNAALAYLGELSDEDAAMKQLIADQYKSADNMTDRMAALARLSDVAGPEREAALADFYERFKTDPLVLDKWLALQATSTLPDTLDRVKALMSHPAFSMRNPNKVRSLVGAFTMANPLRYHAADGAGYDFHAERTIELNATNPQVAARLLSPLGRWKRFDTGRQAKMKAALDRILAEPKLSREVYEIASKSRA
jgi:aminopeptidase N